MAAQAGEQSPAGQVMKRYFLFNSEVYEEKAKKGNLDFLEDEGPSYETRVKFSSLATSQGIAVINNEWFVLGTLKTNDVPSPVPSMSLEQRSMLLVCVKEGTKIDLQSHVNNYGLWSRVVNENGYIITMGEDYVEEKATGGAASGKRLAIVVKVWDAKKLSEGKYYSLEELLEERKDHGKDGKTLPKIIYLNRPVGIKEVSAVGFSDDFTRGVIGLTSGHCIYFRVNSSKNNLFTDKSIQFMNLSPAAGFDKPITNVNVVASVDEANSPVWLVFCTSEDTFYCYTITQKTASFAIISGFAAPPRTMASRGLEMTILDPENEELRRYVGHELREKWPIEEAATVQGVYITDNNIVTVRRSEKNKTIKVYDMTNNIISYQAIVAEALGIATSSDCIYLFLKKVTTRVLETLREKSNIDKLETFLKKKHFDVAFSFAKNAAFPGDVLAEIARYHGDFYLGKVQSFGKRRICTRRR